jgi:hypothetical protein
MTLYLVVPRPYYTLRSTTRPGGVLALALLMLVAITVLRFISPQDFQRMACRDMTAALALESAN